MLNSRATASFIYDRTRCCRCVLPLVVVKKSVILASARVVPVSEHLPVWLHSEISVHTKRQSRGWQFLLIARLASGKVKKTYSNLQGWFTHKRATHLPDSV